MTCRRAVYILGCADQRLRPQGHQIENAYSAISNQLYTILARLHFSAEELLLYPRRQRRRRLPCRRPRRVGVHMQMLGQMLKSWNLSLSVFFLAF